MSMVVFINGTGLGFANSGFDSHILAYDCISVATNGVYATVLSLVKADSNLMN
jgi:hypothetical protein